MERYLQLKPCEGVRLLSVGGPSSSVVLEPSEVELSVLISLSEPGCPTKSTSNRSAKAPSIQFREHRELTSCSKGCFRPSEMVAGGRAGSGGERDASTDEATISSTTLQIATQM